MKQFYKKNYLMLLITVIALLGGVSEASAKKKDPYSKYNASWMAGNWGVTHVVNGGYKLDAAADSSDWVAGAEEIVKKLPSITHVITFLSHPAQGYLYTLRDNDNVDIASEIHKDMVPSRKNEQIIFDVIDVYRRAGIKVILYINTVGPGTVYNRERDGDITKAWKTYYNSKWNGDEGAAWRDLVHGYVTRLDGLVDGYWLDNVGGMPGDFSDFVTMLRSVDPTLSIGMNRAPKYFTDKKGDYLYVDSDGKGDKNETDYKIIRYGANNQYENFTSGHVSPLAHGAPPNSWAYEEYTLPEMAKTPWDSFHGNYVLKHSWVPIRTAWHTSSSDLVFEVEQAYRFVRRITDGGAAMTWATTQVNGKMKSDEMKIMAEINNRMSQKQKEDYQPYKRPKGASLVGSK